MLCFNLRIPSTQITDCNTPSLAGRGLIVCANSIYATSIALQEMRHLKRQSTDAVSSAHNAHQSQDVEVGPHRPTSRNEYARVAVHKYSEVVPFLALNPFQTPRG